MSKKYRILLVEDDDGVRLSLRDYLKARSYTVFVASDGVGAIKIMLDHHVDIIVTDYRMSVFGGDYWVRFLHEFCKDKFVIVSSGFVRPDFSIPFEVLQKPFEYSSLEEKLREYIETLENKT
mgnify:CR=1 FL=1